MYFLIETILIVVLYINLSVYLNQQLRKLKDYLQSSKVYLSFHIIVIEIMTEMIKNVRIFKHSSRDLE